MIVLRQAPTKNFPFERIGNSEVHPLNVTFKRCDEDSPDEEMPSGWIEVSLNSSPINDVDSDRHKLFMSPSEVILLFASLPPEKIADAAGQFFATLKRYGFERGNTELNQPDCAITKTEFADRLLELFRATLDWK